DGAWRRASRVGDRERDGDRGSLPALQQAEVAARLPGRPCGDPEPAAAAGLRRPRAGPRSAVGDLDQDATPAAPGTNRDGAAAVLDGVVKQIPEDLREPAAVRPDGDRSRAPVHVDRPD